MVNKPAEKRADASTDKYYREHSGHHPPLLPFPGKISGIGKRDRDDQSGGEAMQHPDQNQEVDSMSRNIEERDHGVEEESDADEMFPPRPVGTSADKRGHNNPGQGKGGEERPDPESADSHCIHVMRDQGGDHGQPQHRDRNRHHQYRHLFS